MMIMTAVVGNLAGTCRSLAADAAAFTLTERLLRADADIKIVAFGDSITGIYYHSGGVRAGPELVETLLRRAYPDGSLTVINAGRSGNTAGAGLQRMQQDVLDRKPDLVVVAFGMNDAAVKGDDAGEADRRRRVFVENLREIVRRCQGIGAEVVLCTPTNVYPDAAPARSLERLADFAAAVRDTAAELGVPVADCFAAFTARRRQDLAGWRLLMSETIHPSRHGHQLIAEVVAGVICGQATALGPLKASSVFAVQARNRIRTGQPLRILAMLPLAEEIPALVQAAAPEVNVEITAWPAAGQTLDAMVTWARRIRQNPPDLVVLSLPPAVLDCRDEESFVRQASWVVNWSLPFAERTWEVLCLAPRPEPGTEFSPTEAHAAKLFEQIVAGHDLPWLDVGPGVAPAVALGRWLTEQLQPDGAGQ
jgi:lysophospholipase L1-like esterase